MLNKAPDPDENHRLRQSIREWGPGGVSVIQEGPASTGSKEAGRKRDGTLVGGSIRDQKNLENLYKTNLPASRGAGKPPQLCPTRKTCSKYDHFNSGRVHLHFKRANIIITLLLSTPAMLNGIQVGSGRHLAPCTRDPLLRAPGMQTSCERANMKR